ncbi:MAG: hypothetical protein A2312_02980 [Candidatus Staskawiczbacteria bacterium RIFOXYB2_FULL_32_9]|uniref:Uncharacterized protein n=1 Tax=Candidatus Staskawiczbacteria bacterium RIFOXYD1_FULL_32_13 TaxID=1802234 RepID=A0A1G2JPK0_9BACT|nr:MAG: hypothetical protein UR22_C0002G0070 [Parcubacteria group bacterium GW2011_GWC2_32_10]OGZ78669.1 MAG: hypothetical protein A2360_00545 [Candidatus Staskawiczbacteria bacterium RIFOXYB1_FULL_32_11]OGZ81538.1 MAG: hypothetical protein A2312_02980 [Candidatus Staskawiczbacteria bacterium RIFOXYB2_FULL_32_9]OGZ88188.1 MAG: hypothetical protein A2561_05285 [Candidatus Staskawiczbacteria bacterium RIFOXYD1_FULL_32_13]
MVNYLQNLGNSIGDAIVITGVLTDKEGTSSEYQYISDKFGKRDVDWKLKTQSLLKENGKHFDKIDITLNSGEEKTFYFDVESFWDKESGKQNKSVQTLWQKILNIFKS